MKKNKKFYIVVLAVVVLIIILFRCATANNAKTVEPVTKVGILNIFK